MKFRRPPTLKTADDFISAAGTPNPTSQAEVGSPQPAQAPATSPAAPRAAIDHSPASNTGEGAAAKPWEGKRADKQTEVFNLRLTEVELEKLRYIAANTPDSMQAFVRKTLLPAIDAKLDDLA